jgi:hypothetical protein
MTTDATATQGLPADQAPGVYWEQDHPAPAPSLVTGVPVFLGHTGRGATNKPARLTLWPQFEAAFGTAPDGYLADAVRGFFANDGLACYVVPLDQGAAPVAALRDGLAAARDLDTADLLCAPDIMRPSYLVEFGLPNLDAVLELQIEVRDECRGTGGRFAILDRVPTADRRLLDQQRDSLDDANLALYHPWLWTAGPDGQGRHVPPSGHVAGVYSRCDQRAGVSKSPANEVVDGALDLRSNLTDGEVAALTAAGVNCLVAQPGRGLRVWGARTLSKDPAWRHVSARRVFLTLGRWLERFMLGLVHEPNDLRLRIRVMREVTAFLDELFARGALMGRSPEEAFFVKCDDETNPPEIIDAGMLVMQVGLALTAPAEVVVVRVIHGAGGVTVQPGAPTA